MAIILHKMFHCKTMPLQFKLCKYNGKTILMAHHLSYFGQEDASPIQIFSELVDSLCRDGANIIVHVTQSFFKLFWTPCISFELFLYPVVPPNSYKYTMHTTALFTKLWHFKPGTKCLCSIENAGPLVADSVSTLPHNHTSVGSKDHVACTIYYTHLENSIHTMLWFWRWWWWGDIWFMLTSFFTVHADLHTCTHSTPDQQYKTLYYSLLIRNASIMYVGRHVGRQAGMQCRYMYMGRYMLRR